MKTETQKFRKISFKNNCETAVSQLPWIHNCSAGTNINGNYLLNSDTSCGTIDSHPEFNWATAATQLPLNHAILFSALPNLLERTES